MKFKIIIISVCLIGLSGCSNKRIVPEVVHASGLEHVSNSFVYCSTCLGPTPKYLDVVEQNLISTQSLKRDTVVQAEPTIVYYDLDSSNLKAGYLSKIKSLRFGKGSIVTISGFTDGYGNKSYNRKLAKLRATKVLKVLSNSNSSTTFKIKYSGKCCYVTSSPFGSKNRRVEIREVEEK